MPEARRLPEILALLVLLGSALVVVQAYPELPHMINTHFDAGGRPDGIGPKSTLWWIVGVTACIYIVAGIVGALPAGVYRATGKTFTPEGPARFVAMSGQSISWIKAELVGVFFVITCTNVLGATSSQPQLAGTLLMYFFILLLIATAAYYVVRSYRIT